MPNLSPQRGTNPQTRDVNAAQRVAMAIKMRASKMTYDAIAAQCGFSNASSCRKAVLRELERVVVTNVDELRREEAVTLDMLQTECMKLFLDKDNKARLFAADRLLAVMERRAKMFGIDVKVDDNVNNNITVVREVPQGYLGNQETKL